MDSNVLMQCLKNQKLSPPEECNFDIIESQLDIISKLPDDIIFHILSFLPIEDTVCASSLSKRWKYLWLSLPVLVIDLYTNRRHRPRNFRTNVTNFIDRLLFTLRTDSYIHKFQLSCDRRTDCSHFYSWVCAVIRCNVRELDLKFLARYSRNHLRMPELSVLPQRIFTSQTLVVLKIDGRFVLNVPDHVHLPNLKTLYLRSLLFFNNATLQKLLSGCPVLDDLGIIRDGWDCPWAHDVCVPSLKKFTLNVGCNEGEEYLLTKYEGEITVNAPKIEYLEFCDWASTRISIDMNLSAVVKAHVSIFKWFGFLKEKEKEYGNRAYGLLRTLSNVKHLSLTGYTLQSLDYAAGAHFPTYYNLVHLELGLDKMNGPVPFPDLLKSSPKLELLIFWEGITLPGGMTHSCRVPAYKYHWIPPPQVPKCLICSLKTIVVHEFCGAEEEMKLVKYLLKNAMILEKMTIFSHHLCPCPSSDFGDELSNYAKGASNCEFMLHIKKKKAVR